MSHDDEGWRSLGERVALARSAKSLSQAEVAGVVGLERTALAKIEAGVRRVSALELGRLSSALGRSVTWFIGESPAPIVSRRAELVHEPTSAELNAELLLEDLVIDVRSLLEIDALRVVVPEVSLGKVASLDDAERAAEAARAVTGDEAGPLPALAEVLGSFGLMVYTEDLGPSLDGLAVRMDEGLGVCLVNSSIEPGRRRATAAHELGHFLFDDAYSIENLSAHSGDERERLIDAFAAAFLLPARGLRAEWGERVARDGLRPAAVAVAARYRVSWGTLRHRLRRLDLLSEAGARELGGTPVKAEFIACGVVPEPDLDGVSVPPVVGAAVMSAYGRDEISGHRALEMLRGTVDDLPPSPMLSMYALRGDFYPSRTS